MIFIYKGDIDVVFVEKNIHQLFQILIISNNYLMHVFGDVLAKWDGCMHDTIVDSPNIIYFDDWRPFVIIQFVVSHQFKSETNPLMASFFTILLIVTLIPSCVAMQADMVTTVPFQVK